VSSSIVFSAAGDDEDPAVLETAEKGTHVAVCFVAKLVSGLQIMHA